jgi:Frizzled/Smoothened family membrane region
VPLLIYFSLGVILLTIGFLNLWSLRSSLKKTHPGMDKTSKLTQLMSKIGVFSVLYTVPAIFVILSLFYEQHYRPQWEVARLCPCARQFTGSTTTTALLLSLVKIASMLVVGWTSGIWICSTKTLQSWCDVLCCLRICFSCCCCPDDSDEEGSRHHHRRGKGGYLPAATDSGGGLAPLPPPHACQHGSAGVQHHYRTTPNHGHLHVNPMDRHQLVVEDECDGDEEAALVSLTLAP